MGLVGETAHTSDLSYLPTGSRGQWPLFHRVASDPSPRSSPPPPPPVLTTEKWSENRTCVQIIWMKIAGGRRQKYIFGYGVLVSTPSFAN